MLPRSVGLCVLRRATRRVAAIFMHGVGVWYASYASVSERSYLNRERVGRVVYEQLVDLLICYAGFA